MKRFLKSIFVAVVLFLFCSCAPKQEVRPTESPPPPPPANASAAEAASYKAEVAAERAERAAKRAEDSANQVRGAVAEMRAAAERAERAAKRCEDSVNQARGAAERTEKVAKGCEESAPQARESAERAERAAKRAEALLAGKPAPVAPAPIVEKPEPPKARTQEAQWGYEKDAIRLRVKSDPQLNLYQRSPHTLVLCVYQLKDPNAFNQQLEEKEGLWKLLECGRFDPSVTHSKRVVIQPGQEVTELLDRPEGARYVGLVAGYYALQKERVVRLFPIPVVSEKKGNMIFLKPGMLNIDLYMGPQEIQEHR